LPETTATVYSVNSIGNSELGMAADEYRGMVVRIVRGRGRGQERTVISNTATELRVSGTWSVVPDGSSVFVIAEPGWRFGAVGMGSPIEFETPLRAGATVHISGRAANVNDEECAYELSPLTRWRLGSGAGGADTGVPPRPVFGLQATGRGNVEVRGIGFEELTNTRTITAGILTLHYWPEAEGAPGAELSTGVSAESSSLELTEPVSVEVGARLQLEGEIVEVTAVAEGGLRCDVARGVGGSTASAHAAGTKVYVLRKLVRVLPFPKDFFGSPASGSRSDSITLPGVRIACAELKVRNNFGESEPGRVCLTGTTDYGLRTLRGGQLVIQAEGYLTIQSNVAPALVIEETTAIRDVFAIVGEPPAGGPVELRLRQDEEEYCRLMIGAGESRSNTVDGLMLKPLRGGSRLSLDVLATPSGAGGSPGKDLTVTIRL
jgi:hypothetical protein